MKRFRYLLFFYVIVLAGCDRQSAYERLLLEADSLIEQHTDSALRLLESIPDVADKGNEASRAYYTLLLTQARYVGYRDTGHTQHHQLFTPLHKDTAKGTSKTLLTASVLLHFRGSLMPKYSRYLLSYRKLTPF